MKVFGIQTPRIHFFTPYDTTHGDKAIRLARLAGVELDPWQQLVVRDWLATDENGDWVHSRGALACSRQQGKSKIIEVVTLYSLVVLGESVLFTSHRADTARAMFDSFKTFFDARKHPDIAKYLKGDIRNANGQQEILTTTGGSLHIGTRYNGVGRGRSFKRIWIDEAQDYSEKSQSDIEPTTTSFANSFIGYCGTPPDLQSDGEIFKRLRTEAILGKGQRLAYAEWSAEKKDDGSHLDDIESWRQAVPALGYRVTLKTIQDQRSAWSDNKFEVERLCMFNVGALNTAIPMAVWDGAFEEGSQGETDHSLGLSSYRPDGGEIITSVVLVSKRADDNFHVELVERKAGTDWVVPLIVDLVKVNEIKAVVLDAFDPAMVFVEPLKKRGVRALVTRTNEYFTACGVFSDLLFEGRMKHIGQEQMRAAFTVTSKRYSNARWAWKQATNEDITAVQAATVALHGALQEKVKAPQKNKTKGYALALS